MLFTLAARRIRHRFRTFLAFFFSSAAGLLVYSLYNAMRAHPALGAAAIQESLGWSTRFVGLFSLLLILQLHAGYVNDGRESIRLLLRQGMRPFRVALILQIESGLVALSISLLGLALSALFTRLVSMVVGRLANLPNPPGFHFSAPGLGRTLLLVGLAFLLSALYSFWVVYRTQSNREKRRGCAALDPGQRRPVRALLPPLLLLAAGYGLFLTATDPEGLARVAAAAVALLLPGTLLLFTRSLPMLFQWLRERKSEALDGIDLVTLAQCTGRIERSGPMLAIAAALLAFDLLILVLAVQRWVAGDGSETPVGLFVIAFIGLLIFLVVGSLLFLQLIAGLEQDRGRIDRLRRLGLWDKALREIASAQVSLVFGLPVAAGLLHAVLILWGLGRAAATPPDRTWDGWVILGYLLAHTLYALLARSFYLRAVVGAPPEPADLPVSPGRGVAPPPPRRIRRGLFYRISALLAMLGGLLIALTMLGNFILPRAAQQEGHFYLALAFGGLSFLIALLALSSRISGRVVRFVVYPGIAGAAMMFIGALPPLTDFWGLPVMGMVLLGLGLTIIGAYHFFTRTPGPPLRGLVAVATGIVPLLGFIKGVQVEVLPGAILLSLFGVGWVWIGGEMLRMAASKEPGR